MFENLKNAIEQLYCKEGRTITYISKLFEINKNDLKIALSDWKFERGIRVTPSMQKFLNSNKEFIIARLKEGVSIKEIEKLLHASSYNVNLLFKIDPDLAQARQDYLQAREQEHAALVSKLKNESHLEYDIPEIAGEEWVSILGYPGYEISNKGRVKNYSARYKSYYLLKPSKNAKSGRLYVTLYNNKEKENLQIARLVGIYFCKGHSETANTINHIDGNIENNDYTNLEWVSQSDNNKHAYDKLHRVANKGTTKWEIIYQNQYHFKSIAAYARFIGKSETQARRYMDNPEKYDIQVFKRN